MPYTNKTLSCIECNISFIFSADEQQFFDKKELRNEPRRCPDCRIISRFKKEGKTVDKITKVNCADCGIASVVPFVPTGRKPVYCGACLRTRNSSHTDAQRGQLIPAG